MNTLDVSGTLTLVSDVVGLGAVDQTIPRSLTESFPREIIFEPRVAVVDVMFVTVGSINVGEKVLSAKFAVRTRFWFMRTVRRVSVSCPVGTSPVHETKWYALSGISFNRMLAPN